MLAAACTLAMATGSHPLFAQPAPAAAAVQLPGKEFKDGYIEVSGFRIHYKEAGPKNGPVLISLPGSAGLEMSRAKDHMINQYHIIELNPPGWADDPELTREMDQDEIGKILGQAANQLVSGKYAVLGTSMGGANALWLAVQYPQRVKSIVLESSMAPTRQADLFSPMIYRADVRKSLAAGQNPMGAARGAGPGSYPAPPTDPAKPWATPEFMGQQMAQRFKMFKWVQADMGTQQLFSKIRATNIPVLGLIGDKDGIIKPSVESYYREVLPNAKFVLVPGGNHDLQNSQTDAFVAQVSQFLGQNK